ncbi:unnamed protein product [Nesidiocoris tenuis]|uniref:DUF5641 domain-containing protein n=1 Tax=Nesidiocoris tenuis TaxID=355587 RepID=A0A6H5G4A1_9HEMI|nr:unnamed protein product [Nesidiocoris tenuis]
MFLKDLPNDQVVDIDEIMDSQRLNNRLQHRKKLRKDLRNRFRSEYLGSLIRHPKDELETRKVKVGDVVLIGDDEQRRLNWVLARIEEFIPGNDGHHRLARLVTPRGKLIRPLRKIYPLEGITKDDDRTQLYEDTPQQEQIIKQKTEQTLKKKTQTGRTTAITTRSGRKVNKPDRLGISENFVAV